MGSDVRTAVLFDRDNTLNLDLGYDPRLEVLPGVNDALRIVHTAGLPVGVVSNQRKRTVEQVEAFNEQFRLILDVDIPLWLYCTNDTGPRRKPEPGMIYEAMRELACDDVVVIGDKPSDAQAGVNAGGQGVLLADKVHGTHPTTSSIIDAALFAVSPHSWRRKIVGEAKAPGDACLLMSGSYDLIHLGHMLSFAAAHREAKGLPVVVAVNSDASVRAYKGREPRQTQLQRAVQVAASGFVDYVVLMDDTEPSRLIETLRPAVYCVSEEYRDALPEYDAVRNVGARLAWLHRVHTLSSTALREGRYDVE